MNTTAPPSETAAGPSVVPAQGLNGEALSVVLSFDVEEHFRIEAAAGLSFDEPTRRCYLDRVGVSTRWVLDELDRSGQKATFFVVGLVARDDPGLVRTIHRAGHEVASHGWDHRRVTEMTPDEFREDLRRSLAVLEDLTGEAVSGYRAPTFSIVGRTPWAIDELAGRGLLYDSSVYPVRHDRYGVPHAPRAPFLAGGALRTILELPPLTLRLGPARLPIGGGGYFRLFPTPLLEGALSQAQRECRPPVAVLYFHPWEFDPDQPRLALRGLNRWRTYVGIGRARARLSAILDRHNFARAVDVAKGIDPALLPRVAIAGR